MAMSHRCGSVHGAGLGLRRAFLDAVAERPPEIVGFYEVAPENWIGVGGRKAHRLRVLTERHPFVCHGLSLSIGGPEPLDLDLVRQIKRFLDSHGIDDYTEHLSYCSDDGHLYDLLPIPFTDEAVRHVAGRVRQVQEILERRIALENVSYYAAPGRQMTEIAFVNAVLEEADCDLLLDINNIYVNGINHGYDPESFLAALPGERIRYGHVAGHYEEAPDLRVDTHGADVIDPVWALLGRAYEWFGVFPTLLERDFNIPPLEQLLREVEKIRRLQAVYRVAAPTGLAGA
ncbi:HvfB family MNIO-type RiPP peptide maturase [Thioalkalicoccus limnaeus]|uniref:HvfB family MNIO-type RiPP peptide maturase n=1 Tax=Thioalkalicoccus limnaeus TaxID=120681 RepID=UPI003F74AD09